MKGKISRTLMRILTDPSARDALFTAVKSGRGGTVVAHGITYRVDTLRSLAERRARAVPASGTDGQGDGR